MCFGIIDYSLCLLCFVLVFFLSHRACSLAASVTDNCLDKRIIASAALS